MRIRIWNAFASNNSGSYVIVGAFPTAEQAAKVAAELREVAVAQTAWQKQPGDDPPPLAAYAARHRISTAENFEDQWPEYTEMPHPAVWAVGHQVFVYSDYTITMPPVLGHLMYVHGGRVETELNHAHHPITAVFEIWFPWQQRKSIDVPARVQDIVDALADLLRAPQDNGYASAWRGIEIGDEKPFSEVDLTIGAAFTDLQAGFTAIEAACKAHGAGVRVRLAEAPPSGDPFAFLRPCAPLPSS